MDDLNYNDMSGTSVSKLKSKSKYNIGQLARNIEYDLQKNNYSDNDNYSSESDGTPRNIKKKHYKKPLISNNFNFYNFKDYDIIILSIIFLLLNINYSINFLNDYLIYFKNIDISYINVTIRSIIFAILFYLVKKFI